MLPDLIEVSPPPRAEGVEGRVAGLQEPDQPRADPRRPRPRARYAARRPVERGHAGDGRVPGAAGLRRRGGGRSGRARQPHAHGPGRRRQDPQRRHAGQTPGALRRECRHGRALPAADAVPGPWQLPRERHRAHAPAAAGGAGRGPAPARLSHRHAQRPAARRHPRHRPAAGCGLQRQRRGELAVRVGPAALGRHRRLAGRPSPAPTRTSCPTST